MRRLPLLATTGLAMSALAGAASASPGQDYTLYCMGCHGAEAQGVPGRIPALAGTLARFMSNSEGRNYVLRVPGAANSALSDARLAAVLNWLTERYGAADAPHPAPFTEEEVARARRVPLADVQAARREVVRKLAASGAAPAADY
ncbi:MAG: cytochrome c [Gammaproteobacteria bacterium]|nr:MAG: cytochrome c [Gammaproteobacteria bacterium]